MQGVTIERNSDSKNFVVHCELWLPHPIESVFAFFADAFQLERITPDWLKFKVLTPRPIEMSPGALIDYKLRLRGIPIRWRTRIEDWEPPHRFVDLQIRGPYRLWRHEHTFVESDGGTLVGDCVNYNVPGGRLVNWLVVQRDVERIFSFRHEQLRTIFATTNSVGRHSKNVVASGTEKI